MDEAQRLVQEKLKEIIASTQNGLDKAEQMMNDLMVDYAPDKKIC